MATTIRSSYAQGVQAELKQSSTNAYWNTSEGRAARVSSYNEAQQLAKRHPAPSADISALANVDQLGNPVPAMPSIANATEKAKTVAAAVGGGGTTNPPSVAAVSLSQPVPPAKPTEPHQIFPSSLIGARYKMMIFFAPYNADLALSNKGAEMKTETSIAFPLPANLLSSTGLDYTNINLGAIGGEVAGAAKSLVNAPNFLEELNAQARGAIKLATGNDAKSNDLRQLLVRRLLNSVSPTLGSTVDLIKGSTPNPHVAVTFNNVKLRTFSFTWKFSPTSADESKALHKIIKTIQRRVLPEKSSEFLLMYPNQVMLEIVPDPLNKLFQFKPAVITDVSVNYAPNGNPSFFRDDMPTDVELSLSFQEIQIRVSGDYN